MEKERQKKDSEREEDIRRLRELRPIDDDFMRCLFRENIPLIQHVLEEILQRADLKIIDAKTQADMKRLVGGRSICLDVYCEDLLSKKYDIEIQRSDKGAGVHRARYHSSAMDVENLDVGQDFEELPETYTIFITENDIYKQGLSLYHIERINMTTGELFGDGEHILYVNGSYRGDDEIGKMMHDFSCSNPSDMYNQDLADKTRYFKETEEGVETVCKIMEDMRKEKEVETRTSDIRKMMKTLKLTVEQALDALEVPNAERNFYLDKLCAK